MADGVQRVDAEIHQRSASAEFSAEPPRAHWLLTEETTLKRFHLTDIAGSDDLDGPYPRGIIMNAVADH